MSTKPKSTVRSVGTTNCAMSFNTDFVNRLDKYAYENFLTRTSLITLACTKYLNEQELISQLKEVVPCIKKVVENNKIDEKSKKLLDDFNNAIALLLASR